MKSPEELAKEAAEAAFEAAMPPAGPKLAARVMDAHICPLVDGIKPHVGGPVTQGEPTVIICGMMAARVGDMVTCASAPDTIMMGSPTVTIGGKLAARFLDQTVHGGVITAGAPTVIIGDGGAGSSPSPGRMSTSSILANYQIADDTMVKWEPIFPASLLTEPRSMTQTEANLLDDLQFKRGLMGQKAFKEIVEAAYSVSNDRYAGQGAEDGHQDAFRHAYWNALMTKEFGEDFAASFASAHEGVPGNPADREAMDLYNNEVGRRVARENPDASEEELADLVADAVSNGDVVVIDGNNNLSYSDEVPLGGTGTADDPPHGGGQAPPEWSRSD